MSARPTHRSTRLGLILLAAALGVSLFSFALGSLWTVVLAALAVPSPTAESLRNLWIPLSGILVEGAAAVLALLGFVLLWNGRWEIGGSHASRAGLGMLAVLVAAAAFAFYAVTGVLLGYVPGAAFLAPWHGLLAAAGSVALGLGLYWMLSNLPVPGARPLAAVALALGLSGIAILNLPVLGLRRVRVAGLEGAGLALSLVSLTLWLVICLWGEETLRSRGAAAPTPAPSDGS